MEMITSLAKPIGPKKEQENILIFIPFMQMYGTTCVLLKQKMHILDENIIPHRGCDDREIFKYNLLDLGKARAK